MANSELSKLKILFIYDYFLRHVSAFDENSGITISDLIDLLEDELGYRFERKSIYADFSKINEYVSANHKIVGQDSWIYLDGKKYRKSQLADEITVDEARLIVDAINTTSFTDTSICDKIKKLYPVYFDSVTEGSELYSRDRKIDHKSIAWLNNIRNAIEGRLALKIDYGYKLGKDVVEKSAKIVSPIVLDWTNNNYYLIAIDNSKVGQGTNEELKHAMRRYRLDRMSSVTFAQKNQRYMAFSSERAMATALRSFLDNSLSAYSTDSSFRLRIKLKGDSHKTVLQAYNAFADKVGPAYRINDSKLTAGELGLEFEVADVPTLYTAMFEIVTFEGIDLQIDNSEISEKFRRYLDKAAKLCN